MNGAENSLLPEETSLFDLPDGCLHKILSFLSPQELCQASLLCKSFFTLAFSDTLWAKFLPADYAAQLMSLAEDDPPGGSTASSYVWSKFLSAGTAEGHQAQGPPVLYSLVRQAIELPGLKFGAQKRQSVWVDRKTGRQGAMLAPAKEEIVWGTDERYWNMEDVDGAWFKPCRVLTTVCWFEVHSTFRCKLPPGCYTASWRFGVQPNFYGFHVPHEFTVTVLQSSQTLAVELNLGELLDRNRTRRQREGRGEGGEREREARDAEPHHFVPLRLPPVRLGEEVNVPGPLPPVHLGEEVNVPGPHPPLLLGEEVDMDLGEPYMDDELAMYGGELDLEDEHEGTWFHSVVIGEINIEEGWENVDVEVKMLKCSNWKQGLVVDCFCLLPS